MILPGSYLFSVILLFLSLLCLGSWANTFKLTAPRWRFELYCYDFAIGAIMAAIIIAFTFGSLGLDGFTVMDDLRLAGKQQDGFAFLGGCVFCLGNFLIMSAVSLAGLSVAFPVGLGIAMITGTAFSYLMNPAGSGVLLIAGCAAVLAGIVFSGLACRKHLALKAEAAHAAALAAAEEAAASSKPGAPPKKKLVRKKPVAAKALAVAAFGGLVSGACPALFSLAQRGENGLGPYCTALLFAVGVLFSTFVYNLFFMNLPIHGAAIDFTQYFTGRVRDHVLGFAGGIVWFIGAVLSLVAMRADGPANPGTSLSFGMSQGAMVVGALWGLAGWEEFSGADSNNRLYLGVMLLLLTLGIIIAAMAPLYGGH
jgi:glucose uptake protein